MLTRDAILELLRSMGVDLPRKTKLPDTELDKRLSKALDSAQYLTRVVPDPPLSPSVYSSWFADRSNSKLVDGVRRHNVGEATIFAQGNGNPFPLGANAFWDLRQTIMGIGDACDTRLANGDMYPLTVSDEEDTSGIAMRVVDVRRFDKNTPILLLLYHHDVRNNVSKDTIAWMRDNIDNERSMVKVTATLKEQELLLRLLQQNSKRIAKTYRAKRRSTESSFTLSFLLPVGPLTARDTAKYNTNNGCTVCGEPAKSKCSRCGAVRYCDAVCQKDDWKAHKALCSKLQGAKWQSLPFNGPSPLRGMYAFTVNKFDIVQHQDIEKRKVEAIGASGEPTEPPENTHGASPFIIKVQLSSPNAQGHAHQLFNDQTTRTMPEASSMLIYDQRRTFEVNVWAQNDPVSFKAVADVVRNKGDRGIKTFCWAVRSGEWTMDICLDDLPDWQNW
uniref:MYND-type domain-containing protein n=1 Tax=Mycena chlorophos TaxID=658473 RepID=A0ABQ0LEX0_MYCCL|nr:predicted protein [Mycena chlorophos]